VSHSNLRAAVEVPEDPADETIPYTIRNPPPPLLVVDGVRYHSNEALGHLLRSMDRGLRRHERRRKRHIREKEALKQQLAEAEVEIQRLREQNATLLRARNAMSTRGFWSWLLGGGR
jgi:hypothetical protein